MSIEKAEKKDFFNAEQKQIKGDLTNRIIEVYNDGISAFDIKYKNPQLTLDLASSVQMMFLREMFIVTCAFGGVTTVDGRLIAWERFSDIMRNEIKNYNDH